MQDLDKKREKEREILLVMIELYCRKNHGSVSMCEDCRRVYDYSVKRIQACPFMESKSFCSSCSSPCYSPKMQERIRDIMKFSGPRMIFYRPVTAGRHMFDTLKRWRKE